MTTDEGMTQDALWEHYLSKNPHWQENGVRLTAAGLKKLFDQTWDQGSKVGHHQAVGKSIRDQLGDFGDLFEK